MEHNSNLKGMAGQLSFEYTCQGSVYPSVATWREPAGSAIEQKIGNVLVSISRPKHVVQKASGIIMLTLE